MHPFPFTQQPAQKRSRADFASSHLSDCLSVLAQSSEGPSEQDLLNGTNAPSLSSDYVDEHIYSMQKNKRLKSKHSSLAFSGFHTLDDAAFTTPIRRCAQGAQQPPNTTCPSPDDLLALELQLYPQFNSFSTGTETKLDTQMPNTMTGLEGLPSGAFEPISYLDGLSGPLSVLDNLQSTCDRQQLPFQSFVNPDAMKHVLSLRQIVSPDQLSSRVQLRSSGSDTQVMPRSVSGAAFQPTVDSVTSARNIDKRDCKRFKPFHEEKWNEHLEQLRAFKKNFGHCLVPHTFPENQNLARWVKRQRRQYKLMLAGNKCSTMTQARVEILNDEGFIWDSHEIVWRERYNQLVEYKAKHGHTKVPSYCKENPQLASWVKCQRRQYKLFWEGKRSSMSAERTQLLEDIDFAWEVKRQKSPSDYQKLAQVLSDLH